MSGREVTDEELRDLLHRVYWLNHDGKDALPELRRFAREMQARAVEHAAEFLSNGPGGHVENILMAEAARIRDGRG